MEHAVAGILSEELGAERQSIIRSHNSTVTRGSPFLLSKGSACASQELLVLGKILEALEQAGFTRAHENETVLSRVGKSM